METYYWLHLGASQASPCAPSRRLNTTCSNSIPALASILCYRFTTRSHQEWPSSLLKIKVVSQHLLLPKVKHKSNWCYETQHPNFNIIIHNSNFKKVAGYTRVWSLKRGNYKDGKENIQKSRRNTGFFPWKHSSSYAFIFIFVRKLSTAASHSLKLYHP